jgi:tetratricopeptide (TPR) repeat protein
MKPAAIRPSIPPEHTVALLRRHRVATGVLFFFLLPVFSSVVAQNRDILFNQAARHWQQGDYVEAAVAYGELLRADSTNLFVAFRLAEAFRYDNRYREAAAVYRHVTTLPGAPDERSEAWYHLAMMTKQLGDREGFCRYIEEYFTLGNDTLLLKRASHEAAVCRDGGGLPTDSAPVTVMHLGKNVNTPFSEFGAFQISDTLLVFSALRPSTSSEYQSFALLDYRSAIFSSEIGASGYQKGEEMHKNINRRNTHNANITFDASQQRVFFSRCFDPDLGMMQCRIMTATYRNGRWSRARPLPGLINMEGFTNTQPHYVTLGEAGVLYFVSDRPGGFGGMDIWYALEHDGTFARPVNCGSIINTSGNEVTPFYDTARGVLFFSSDYHHGFGGYDIFRSRGGLSAWSRVINMGPPFNSPANDIYFTVNPSDSNGYFTSNRPGSFHLRGETCCNDIYYYEWIPEVPVIPLVVHTDTLPAVPVSERARRLLPLLLFFHNDEPDQATMSITSTKDYRRSLDEYVALQELYRREYSRGLPREGAAQARDDIDDFFGQYVLGGYEKLEMLTEYLIADLTAGRTVQLLVSGYCSPLSTTEYNINLARRRIHSLVLLLERTRGGVLKPYLDGTAPGGVRLLIYEDPVGKEKASPFVSDNPHDLRNAVYSRAAAFERRIEIALYLAHRPGEMVLISELPRMTTEKTLFSADSLRRGERRVITIPYRNDGESELLIRNVTFNGERLWVQWSNEPLLPGREGKLQVLVYAGDRAGAFQETITITTNLPEPTMITVKGNVYD